MIDIMLKINGEDIKVSMSEAVKIYNNLYRMFSLREAHLPPCKRRREIDTVEEWNREVYRQRPMYIPVCPYIVMD